MAFDDKNRWRQVLLAQMVIALSYELKGHGFDPPGILFHFPVYLYVLVWILYGKIAYIIWCISSVD